MKNLIRRKIRLRNSRRFKRIRASFLVQYQRIRQGGPRVTSTRDISAGGVHFWTLEPLPESSVLDISVYIPALERSVEALGEVLRVRKTKEGLAWYVAVCFLDLNEVDRGAIEEFAETVSKDQEAELMVDHAEIVVRRG